MGEISNEVIRAYALENAIKYGGSANAGAVLAGLFAEGLKKDEIKDYTIKIETILKAVNLMSLDEQKAEFVKVGQKTSKRILREGLPELSNAIPGKIVMRFAPFPSGPLHIGNARTLLLNDEYVKTYNGKLILAVDDTIGSDKKPIENEAYRLIQEGANWLGVNYGKEMFYKSDRIGKYYEYAEELVKKGYMYMCTCSREEIREKRLKAEDCECRNRKPEENLKMWKEMFTAPEGSMSARLKTSMQDPDPAFRDRVMFRISDKPHARIGNKYRIYPLLDFSWAIDDHMLGITHILRGVDLTMETRVEKFIWDIFKWKHPEVIYNGHFAIEGVKISKSKGAQEVKSGEYIGWNDPRMWSLQSLKDRGILPESLRKFILDLGVKKTNITVPINILYTINRKNLAGVPRYFFIDNPAKIKIGGCPELNVKIPFHPSGKLGFRGYHTSQEFLISRHDFDSVQDGTYRLAHLLNFKSDSFSKMNSRQFSFVSEEPDNNPNTKFLQWLPVEADNVKIDVRMPDNTIIHGLGEQKLRDLLAGSIVQFEKFGYVRLHRKDGDRLEFWFAHK